MGRYLAQQLSRQMARLTLLTRYSRQLGFTPAAEPHDEKHQPLREDQIQNAVAFLAHPKVLVLSSL